MSTATNFLYDGPNAVQEQNGSGVTANLLTGGVDERFQRTDSSGAYSYLTDALGSTEALTTSTGSAQATYTYDPYGAASISGSTTNSYDYTGRESDGLGLHYYRARYYNPSTGRFISEDPIGFAGGINKYAYTGDNPISFRDPFGMDRGNGNGGCGLFCKLGQNPLLLTLAIGTEIAGGGPEDPFADAAVAAEVAEFGETAGAAADVAEAEEEAVTGYRAVSDEELYNINDSGEFQPSPTGSEGKYFFDSEGQAWDFGNRMYGEGNFGVVQGNFPSSSPIEIINPATEGPGFVIQNPFLPSGTPTILWP